jgi:hypothetical protein
MATGRRNQLTKQAGEYLVAGELSRRDFIATTFTGNVPDYDIVAVDEVGGHALIQVKATRSSSWVFDIRKYVDIRLEGRRQVIVGPTPARYDNLICVMVKLGVDSRADKFFVLPWIELQRIALNSHATFLEKHGGIRPRKAESFHAAMLPHSLAAWEDKWDLIRTQVQPSGSMEKLAGSTGRRIRQRGR